MAVFLYLFIGAVTLLVGYLIYQQGYWKRRGIPHNEPKFLRGSIAEWRKTKHISSIFKDTYDQFKGTGPFAGFYMLLSKAVVVLDRDLLKNVLIKDFHNFNERGTFHNEEDDPLTGNLFFMDGENWRSLRSKMTPTFTSGKMKQMFETVSKVGKELAAVIDEKVASGPNGSVLEITNYLSSFTADVIGTCAFGLECNSLRDPNAEFVKMGKRFVTETRHNKLVDMFIHSNPRLARRLHMKIVQQEVHDFYMRVVRETIAYREQNKLKRNDFMDMLIELKNREHDALTVEQVAAQAFVFFLAGFETSSTTMGFALYELAKNQDIQDRLRAEMVEVLEKHNQQFTYECMKEMEYLEMVMSETLRMYPIIGHLVRRAMARYETSDPRYYIDAGTMVIVPTIGIHYDPEIYEDPNRFDPERFTEDAIKERPACSWLPFGDGPRNCIGMRFGKMQMAIGMTYLLKNFRFSIAPSTPIPMKINIKSFTWGAENGIDLKVTRL